MCDLWSRKGGGGAWLNFKRFKKVYLDFQQNYKSYRKQLYGKVVGDEKIYNHNFEIHVEISFDQISAFFIIILDQAVH